MYHEDIIFLFKEINIGDRYFKGNRVIIFVAKSPLDEQYREKLKSGVKLSVEAGLVRGYPKWDYNYLIVDFYLSDKGELLFNLIK